MVTTALRRVGQSQKEAQTNECTPPPKGLSLTVYRTDDGGGDDDDEDYFLCLNYKYFYFY